ncbi:MAG: hypothetical protein A2Z42_01380 [Candidatus Woykebacteria bacterium RBG_19FT_COMBO_43_10]|uniref:Adenylate kinase n=1 Tax=Candidatus Woykebacteria bacterium RBG_19FT_COMBO_43_10 TaxID=1802598 RepID=A0A1G1WG83_9BACT|nr:MAG: hypothetical protein A2Z42_01380 [Candidatus Woykebacteria bacterium RBG_19FT_COMBO_43_10]
MNILVFGGQGSGKSTHAKYIADKLEIPYIYTGDLFRELEGEESEKGKKIRDLMKKGILIPNELAIAAFAEYIKKFDLSKGVVLDGFPRNLEQAKALQLKINLIIYVTLPENTAIQRLMERKRYDDTPRAIKKRLDLYKEETKPLLYFYKKKGVKVVEIDNTPSVEEVRAALDDFLEKQSRNKNNA